MRFAAVFCLPFLMLASPETGADDGATIRGAALLGHVKQLAADAWKGRGSGSEGERHATDYIAAHFKLLGCEPAGEAGTFFQEVAMPGKVTVDPATTFALDGDGPALRLGEDFWPFSASMSGRVAGELVFAGYGIAAPELGYDDYADLDVSGKVVVVFRHNPRGEGWDRAARAKHAPFVRKLAHAQDRGAIGLMVVNAPSMFAGPPGPARRQRRDVVMRGAVGGAGQIPFLHLTLAGGRRLFPAAFGATPEEMEKAIHTGVAPRPAARASRRRAAITVRMERETLRGRNVCALLRAGAQDALDEVVVVGAHHDHVGTSGMGSLAATPAERTAIHNGADDNASGTAGVLEAARYLAARRGGLRRSILFLTFTGEERGLLGSLHYVERPTVPLAKMATMINMDMIGRLDGRKLFIGGVKTSPGFKDVLDRLTAEVGIEAVYGDGGMAPSDNTSFYRKRMPVLFFFSGMHRDYHRPSDDWDKVDADGMEKIARLAARTAEEVARQPVRPPFQRADRGGAGPPRAILGVNVAPGDGGVVLASVSPDSPAEKAGLQAGDVLVALDGEPTPDPASLRAVMRKQAIGKTVRVTVERDGETRDLEVTLGRG